MLPTADQSNHAPDVRVHIVNPQGLYLALESEELRFTADRGKALVLSYEADRVAEQLEVIRRAEGICLESAPVPLEEIYERCDRCEELFMPFMIFFDGKRFCCVECRRRVARRPEPRRASDH